LSVAQEGLLLMVRMRMITVNKDFIIVGACESVGVFIT
jgi:hypothetical protein